MHGAALGDLVIFPGKNDETHVTPFVLLQLHTKRKQISSVLSNLFYFTEAIQREVTGPRKNKVSV